MKSLIEAENYELEICIDSLKSAIAAQQCGAHRVELCARLDLDGLTPSAELIHQCRKAITIDLHVIIRPRPGDFTATEKEVLQIISTIETCKEMGVNGVVVGVINNDGSLNRMAMKRIIKTAKPMSVTFHRAFDVCTDPLKTLRELMDLKVDRVLTSGQKDKAVHGVGLISELVNIAQNNIGIMAGSGVCAANIPALWKVGVRQFHFTSHTILAHGAVQFNPSKSIQAVRVLNHLIKQAC